MTQALYYKPSYERLQDRIRHAAPDLEVVLIDEEGRLTLNGEEIDPKHIAPDYLWIHSELFASGKMKDYFRLISEYPNARWLHTVNTGLDLGPYLDLLRRGLTITNNHSQAIAIAEYVMAHILSRFQGLPEFAANQQRHLWKYRTFRELAGTRWVIIGFGHIGQHIARRAKPFGVHVTAVRRSDNDEGLADDVCTIEAMDSALQQADVVVLACASNDATRNLVDSRFLSLLSDSAVLVNVARGDLVVEDDLRQALDGGRPCHAILDVFSREPLSEDSWIWDHPRITLTPHCSNGGSGMRQRSDDLFIENLNRITNGQLLINEVTEKDIR